MHEQKQNEADGELPAPHRGVNPNHQQHRPARFEENWQKFERRKNEELELGEKLRDHYADHGDGTERLLQAAPSSLGARRCKLRAFGSMIHPR